MTDHQVTAEVEQIDPLEEPAAYGGERLLADLLALGPDEGHGPEIGPDLVEALRRDDFAAAAPRLRDLRDWFGKSADRYDVLDSGVVGTDVPALTASAADVPGLELVASQEVSHASGGEVSLKVGGSGVGASAKVTISESLKLTCSPGEVLVASVSLPIRWERRATPGNADDNWIHTEIGDVSGPLPIRFRRLDVPLEARALSSLVVDNRAGGSKPAEIAKSFALEAGADFTIGLKVDAIGLDASLKVSAEVSTTTTLEATLPVGHRYEVSWLGGPWGMRVAEA
ncbi:hypothetical protein [Nocardioides sp.]|uniref:hypothetical protein n=1 Tax=Nocardioides sp. TaxID=35761 RepID=UPI003784344C